MGNYGTEILAPGDGPVTVDIVFIHGLRGDRHKTWTKGSVLWPRDLLKPVFPAARIMTWGYDADVMKFMDKTGQSSISNLADQLLQDLSIERVNPEERSRAIVFVAHSLGGIIVKDALCKAYDELKEVPVRRPRIAAIKLATMGIVFLGTPHRGSNQARWASIANNIASAVLKDHNDKVVDALCRGAETLERVQTSFSRILISLPVWSFFEEQRYGKVGKIVDDDSATLGFPHEEKGWIPADHTDMTKFDNAQDTGFRRVLYGIRCLVDDGLEAREAVKAAASNASRLKRKGNRYISTKEHRFADPQFLSFDCDEFIENVLTCPGRWWKGSHRGKSGLFLKDSVELAPEVDSTTEESFPDSWKTAPKLKHQSTLKVGIMSHVESWKATSSAPSHQIPTKVAHTEQSTMPSTTSATQAHLKGAGTEEHEALLIAAEEGHVHSVERLIKKNVDVNAVGGHGHALGIAASHGRKEVVRTLLNNGANVNLAGGKDGYALHAAAAQSHLDIVKLLLARGANVQIQGGQLRFALTAASSAGNVRIMRVLLDEGAILSAADMENETALHGAVWGGHIDAVKFLLERGIDTEVRGVETGTALDMARASGQGGIAKLLGDDSVEQDDTPNATYQKEPMPPVTVDTQPEIPTDPEVDALINQYLVLLLVASAQNGNEDDVRSLLEAGVSPNGTWGVHRTTALHVACVNGHLGVVQALLEHGADVLAFGGQTGYALHGACRNGHIAIVLLLLAWDAPWDLGTNLGYPLHAAALGGHIEIMNLLLNLGAPINAYGGEFGTALLAAASQGLEASSFLFMKGASVRYTTPIGMTLCDIAEIYGHDDVKQFFRLVGVKSSSFFSVPWLESRLSHLTLKMEPINLDKESNDFLIWGS